MGRLSRKILVAIAGVRGLQRTFTSANLWSEKPQSPLNYSLVNANNGIGEPISAKHYFVSLRDCTDLFFRPNDHGRRIKWAPEEAMVLGRKMFEWLKCGRIGSIPSEVVQEAMQCLAWVVVPYIDDFDESVRSLIGDFFDFVQTNGQSVLSVIPVCHLVGLTSPEEMAMKLSTGLSSNDPAMVVGAINDLSTWLILSNLGRVPATPARLVDELVDRIYLRCLPGLDTALIALADWVTFWNLSLSE